jgi:hypothetical protein
MLNLRHRQPPTGAGAGRCCWKKSSACKAPPKGRRLLAELSHPRAPSVLAFANAHAMNSMAVSAPFFEAMHSADRVLRDGSGMATLFKLLRMEPGLNLNGTDLIPQADTRFRRARHCAVRHARTLA